VLPGLRLGLAGLVGGEDLALPLQEDLAQRLQARPQTADLALVEVDRPGQLLLGEPAGVAVEEQVLEGRRGGGRRRSGRTGEVDRVELLVGVNDATEAVARAHVCLSLSRRAGGLSAS